MVAEEDSWLAWGSVIMHCYRMETISVLPVANCAVILFLLLVVPGQAVGSMVLLGDSITAGLVSEPRGPSYAELIESWLTDDYGESEVANVGCGGTTSLDWHPDSPGNGLCSPVFNLYIDRVVPKLPSKFTSVLLGTNDSVGFFEPGNQPVSILDYGDAIYDLAIQLLSDGSEHVVLMTAPHRYVLENPEVDFRLAGYRNEVLQLCDSEPTDKILCGPDLYQLLQPEHFEAGNIHPNAAGHRLIAEELYVIVPEPEHDLLVKMTILQLAVLRWWRSGRPLKRSGSLVTPDDSIPGGTLTLSGPKKRG